MRVDRAVFRDLGYVTCPGLFTSAEVDGVLDAIRRQAADRSADNELSLGAMQFTSNLYRDVPEVRSLLLDDRILDLALSLLGPDTWCRWDQAVCKGPGAGEFPWHQDNGYTRLPVEHLQLWVALTDAPPERGGLQVEPGGHRTDRPHTWVGNHAQLLEAPDRLEAVDAVAGDVIAFSSRLPHATSPNVTDHERWTYVAELLALDDADDSVPWPHLVVTRSGRRVGAFEHRDPGRRTFPLRP